MAPRPLTPDERRGLLGAARRQRAAWLDALCVGLACNRRGRECALVDELCAGAFPAAGAVVEALCVGADDTGPVLPPGEAFVADALDRTRARPGATTPAGERAAALAEALKHPRHAEAARALARAAAGPGAVADVAARLATAVGADEEAAEALVRRARALYGDAAAAAAPPAAGAAAVAPPAARVRRNRVTARGVRARRLGVNSCA